MIETETILITGMLMALGAGMISFLSPCILPIFPAYISYIAGININDLQGSKDKPMVKKLLSHSILFLAGISLVFISLGAGASFLGHWVQNILTGETGLFIQRIAGIFIVVMGLFIAGVIKIPFLMREKRFQFNKKPVGYLGTFFVGLGFAAGWTPCIGPIFSSILLLSATNPEEGILYTIIYVIGFAIPFLALTFFIGKAKWIMKYMNIIIIFGAVMMIVMGLILFFGLMPVISGFLLDLVEGTWLSKLG